MGGFIVRHVLTTFIRNSKASARRLREVVPWCSWLECCQRQLEMKVRVPLEDISLAVFRQQHLLKNYLGKTFVQTQLANRGRELRRVIQKILSSSLWKSQGLIGNKTRER